MDVVFLPATDPEDDTYGTMPQTIQAFPRLTVHQVRYPTMVWYNERIRADAVAQILSFRLPSLVLVGFSKSGLGAWNITRMLPDRVWATLVFDAPLAREELPPWGTSRFYPDDSAWREDLPIRTIEAFRAAVPTTHKLVLISGESFHGEMQRFSVELSSAGVRHDFLPRHRLSHHWGSGWIEQGLATLLGHRAAAARAEPSD